MFHSSGRWFLGSQRWIWSRNENTRSLARDFSSSRRAPPNAASNLYLSSACFSPTVFMTSVCTLLPCVIGPMPCLTPSSLTCTISFRPSSLATYVVAQLDHLAELPGGVHVHQRKRRLGGIERLHRQVQHHGRVFADRVQHHRVFELGGHLADDVNALRFELLEMREIVTRHNFQYSRTSGGNSRTSGGPHWAHARSVL